VKQRKISPLPKIDIRPEITGLLLSTICIKKNKSAAAVRKNPTVSKMNAAPKVTTKIMNGFLSVVCQLVSSYSSLLLKLSSIHMAERNAKLIPISNG